MKSQKGTRNIIFLLLSVIGAILIAYEMDNSPRALWG
jgi:hypothetical protein